MRIQRSLLLSAALVALPLFSTAAQAAEVCGDGVDNGTANNLADEGCYPAGVTGICESPLSCAQTGAVAPLTGQLVYYEPADLAPTSAIGPSIAFRRTYMSQYDPGYNDPSDTDFMAPLGIGWHHNFLSWIRVDAEASDEVILHARSGQDILFTRVSTTGGYDTYEPQVGFHFDYLRRKQTTPNKNEWELRSLTGAVLRYDDSKTTAKITAIEDAIGNRATLTYHTTGCFAGQLYQVTDASTDKYLEFEYDTDPAGECMLTSVALYAGGTVGTGVVFGYEDYELKTVELGTDDVRTYRYGTDNILTYIGVATGGYIADFTYVDGEAGKVAKIVTGAGVIGYGYGVEAGDCGGSGSATGTCVYYHRKDTTTNCKANSQCSSGEFCGGETTPGEGDTGTCFRATRWLDVSSANEDLIDAVTGSCPTCTDVDQYAWDTGTGGDELLLDGTKDPEDNWTSYARNLDGLVIKRVDNDTNSDATDTDPAGSRQTYYVYGDSTFPGLVTEVRRLSDMKPLGTCDDPADSSPVTTDCKRTIYTYTSGGLLDTRQEIGFTYNSSAAVVSYDFTTDWDYDSFGRVTKYKGPRTDTSFDVTDYTYHASGGLMNLYLKETKRQKGSSDFITTTIDKYDFWGNAIDIEDPNGDYTCLTYHGDRNVLTESRIAMNGQSSCGSSHGDDLTTKYTYDDDARLTRIEKPLGNCVHRTYTSLGQADKIMLRDDCTVGSDGDAMEFVYSDDGLVVTTKYTRTTGGSSVTTYEKDMTYTEARRLETIMTDNINNTRKTYAYEDDGQLASVSDDDFGKTDYTHDDFGQLTEIAKLLVGSTTRDWTLTPGVQQDLSTKVEDPASKDIDWVWDDLGRKVKQVTPESGTTTYVYDPAGNLTTRIEDDGGGDEKTNTFKYDSLNRMSAADYGDADCFTLGDEEINYTYDSLTGCPAGTCVNAVGRLLKVETLMACDDSEAGDDAFDQQTFYGYDNAGRVVQETIEDDGGRSAPQSYSWDKNGNNTKVTAPSGAAMEWLRNDSANSDMDQIHWLKRNGSSITKFGTWMPFGPMKYYRQFNSKYWKKIAATFSWDKGYRPAAVQYKAGGTNIFKIDYLWDNNGNMDSRDYTGAHASVDDKFFTWDGLDRVKRTYRNAAHNQGYNDSITFNTAGDRSLYTHVSSWGWSQFTHNVYYRSGESDLSSILYSAPAGTNSPNGTKTVAFGSDGRGNRTYDVDNRFATDRRDYTYDARNNQITVSGEAPKSPDDGTTDDYTMTNAYDHKNRRIFKSYVNETTDDEAQWFFYYDLEDRLIEVKHTPDISDSGTYSLYQFYWIGERPIAYWQIDYPNAWTTKRYIHSDDQHRPMEVYTWPNNWSNSQRKWASSGDLFGWDQVLYSGGGGGGNVYQPLRFPGQYWDEETQAWGEYDTGSLIVVRPGLHENRYRTYDPFTGTYMQVDPEVDSTWEAYSYAGQNPVMKVDPTGLAGFSVSPFGLTDFFGRFIYSKASWDRCRELYWKIRELQFGVIQSCGATAEQNEADCFRYFFALQVLIDRYGREGCDQVFGSVSRDVDLPDVDLPEGRWDISPRGVLPLRVRDSNSPVEPILSRPALSPLDSPIASPPG